MQNKLNELKVTSWEIGCCLLLCHSLLACVGNCSLRHLKRSCRRLCHDSVGHIPWTDIEPCRLIWTMVWLPFYVEIWQLINGSINNLSVQKTPRLLSYNSQVFGCCNKSMAGSLDTHLCFLNCLNLFVHFLRSKWCEPMHLPCNCVSGRYC